MTTYRKIGLGGTFDHFHQGHQSFLLFASQLADELAIGVTTLAMTAQKKFSASIEPYEVRAAAVQAFLKNFNNSVQIVPLTDQFGPTLTGSSIEAIAATTDTQAGAQAINQKRVELGLAELPIHLQPMAPDQSGEVLSSERIRAGLVNRAGFVYASLFESNLTLSTPQKLFFSQIQGNLVEFPSPTKNIFVVGDTSLEKFLAHHWPYQLGIIDYLKERKDYQPHVVIDETDGVVRASNPAGEISAELAQTIKKALVESAHHIIVSGEEDLSAAALLLLAPLGSYIYYGQPKQGMVELQVTEAKKEEVRTVLASK